MKILRTIEVLSEWILPEPSLYKISMKISSFIKVNVELIEEVKIISPKITTKEIIIIFVP